MIGAGAFSATATGIGISITAVDATANAFRAVSAKASAFKADITGIGAAFKASALKLLPVASFAAVGAAAKQAIDAMGALSDRAADAGVAAPVLQKLAGALGQVGVKGASVEMVARAMQRMAQTTGAVGAEGFARVLGQASRFGTEAERLGFLVKAFGQEQGAAFAAIVRDGGPALESLLSLAAAYPAVSEEAVNAGDRASDALTRASDASKAGWQSMIGDVVLWIESCFGPLPDVAANIANHIIIAFKDVRYSWAEENALP